MNSEKINLNKLKPNKTIYQKNYLNNNAIKKLQY